MTGVNDIRRTFLDYFARHDHTVVPSSPLVPRNDPTLMFTNAGMVQFKNVFTGQETRPYVRAASSQKCVRAGGKHNDLDNVGHTARHHTFFEMLGNFSFGDYFKERAIELAWDLITKEYAIDPKRLTVTVYHDDDDAYDIWRKLTGFGSDRIIRIATSDNFWAMGETGPCGPCSEIFYDHGSNVPGGPPGSADGDGDRYVEIWNLVFMQYEQLSANKRVDLPRPSIDTGMGLERIAAVLQGKTDNYDIDLFQKLIGAVRHEAPKAGARLAKQSDGASRIAGRVIADHLRASSFLIADGVLPSNEGRGYVLRRIMRRAMRYAHQMGCHEPLMYRLVPTLVSEMGEAFPELARGQALITETLKLEEARFKKTLDTGLKLLDEASANLSHGQQLPGDVAFRLYDTYGFPVDLTQDALRPRGIGVDNVGFAAAMKRQKADARRAWKGSGEAATEAIWFELRDEVGATEFLGYDAERAEGVVTALIKGGKPVESLKAGDEGEIVVNQTPFYGESGGQVGDTGVIRGAKAAVFRVRDTQKKLGSLFVHSGILDTGAIRVGDAVELDVDHERRTATRANHSATHLVHEALRQVLGTHVAQKGSLVSPERLRFDFSHTKPVSAEEIARAEDLANAIIIENAPIETRLMAVEDAMQSGAMALFGEKYGDEVRVVSMGASSPERNALGWSVELCGGTHARRTGDIGLVKITAESGTAAGVRRVEALTGSAARAYLVQSDERLRHVAALLRTRPEDAVERLTALLDERRALERQLSDAKKQIALGGGAGGKDGADVVEIGGTRFYRMSVAGVDMKDMKALADDGRAKVVSGIVAIANASADGKLGIVVAVTPDLAGRFNAVDLVREASEKSGGKGGGGRPDMAQAGGPDGSKAAEALAAIEARLGGASA